MNISQGYSFIINIIFFNPWMQSVAFRRLQYPLWHDFELGSTARALNETALNFSGQLPFSTLPNKVGIPFHLGGFRCVLDSVVWWGAKTTRRRQLYTDSVCQRVRIKAICKEHTHIKRCGATCYLATAVQVLQRVGNIKAHILPVFCKYNFKGNQ